MSAVKYPVSPNWLATTDANKLTDRSLRDVICADPLSIFGGYCKMEECFNLYLSGNDLPTKILTQSIITARKEEIAHFVSFVRKKAVSDEKIFQKIIYLFFNMRLLQHMPIFFLP